MTVRASTSMRPTLTPAGSRHVEPGDLVERLCRAPRTITRVRTRLGSTVVWCRLPSDVAEALGRVAARHRTSKGAFIPRTVTWAQERQRSWTASG
jgi:hypothetical protein